MNKKAIIAGAAAAALLTTGLLVPSFAFLSGQSRKVVNRFVSGLITVDLKETLVDPETGKKIDDEPRVYENTYLTVAGRVVDKDPTPIVAKNSTGCYVYVGVRNEYTDFFTIEDIGADWTLVVDADNELGEGVTVYKYNAVVPKSDEDQQLSAVLNTSGSPTPLTAASTEKTKLKQPSKPAPMPFRAKAPKIFPTAMPSTISAIMMFLKINR